MAESRTRLYDGLAARVMWVVAECHRDRTKQRSPLDIKVFMPKRKRRRRIKKQNDAAIDGMLSRYKKQGRKTGNHG